MDKNIDFSILKVVYVDEYSHLEYIHSTIMCKILHTNSEKLSEIDDYLGCLPADFQKFFLHNCRILGLGQIKNYNCKTGKVENATEFTSVIEC